MASPLAVAVPPVESLLTTTAVIRSSEGIGEKTALAVAVVMMLQLLGGAPDQSCGLRRFYTWSFDPNTP
jgi:hypothetical protein